ncbi:MAG: D-ornithine 4,5-aminomutase subunit OraS [Deltaproteobacteria bacterium]|nr:D-ornithine 4,5-aminomutase subunit OraS [Deltaproteobacteria bacterium]
MTPETVKKDDYQKRRKHLAKLSDKELKEKFWKLSEKWLNR